MALSTSETSLEAHGSPRAGLNLFVCVALIVFTWAVLFAVRSTAPIEILDNDQERPLSYMLDAVVNGNWVVQRDDSNDITSKPPLITWMAAVIMAALGTTSLWVPYIVTGLTGLVTALLVFGLARRIASPEAGMLAVMMYLFSMMGMRQLLVIRTDGVLTMLVVAGGIAALAAAAGRMSWLIFWLIAALATLTKGPLGLGLAAAVLPGFLIASLIRRQGVRFPILTNLYGLGLYLALCGGWFALAWWVEGQDVIDKMIGKELVGHATREAEGRWYKPPLYFLAQFAPWALLAIVGLRHAFINRTQASWRAIVAIAGYVVITISIFAMVPHQRPILLMPVVPFAAVLAGIELNRWTGGQLGARAFRWWLALLVLCSLGFGIYYHVARRFDRDVQSSQQALLLARTIEAKVGSDFPLVYTDAPYGIQFLLGTMRPTVSAKTAGRALAASTPIFVVCKDDDEIRIVAGTGVPLHVVAESGDSEEAKTWSGWLREMVLPSGEPGRFKIISNHTVLEKTTSIRSYHGDLMVLARRLTIDHLSERRLRVRHTTEEEGELVLENRGKQVITLEVEAIVTSKLLTREYDVPPGGRRIIRISDLIPVVE